jgi:tripeptide aminopeptidase
MNIVERFLNYVTYDTQSSEETGRTPSTEKQRIFAKHLKDELIAEGLQDVELDELGYLYATLPSNTDKKVPTIGFIAHMDTSPDASGKNVKPSIIKNYNGGDIVLSEGVVTSPIRFPELLNHRGEDLIVTDGTTLLGADDKAGIAEIVQAMVYLQQHPEIKHGKIRVGFNPDEEIGEGAHHFDVDKFECDFAYTMDGSEAGEIEFENFTTDLLADRQFIEDNIVLCHEKEDCFLVTSRQCSTKLLVIPWHDCFVHYAALYNPIRIV